MCQQKAVRPVHILIRYTIKKTCFHKGIRYAVGSVVLVIEDEEGVRCTVTLRPARDHSCTCPHVMTVKSSACYHIEHCRTIENARAARKVAARTLAREVEAIVVEAEKELAREVPPARELAPLNGNRSFSLLRR